MALTCLVAVAACTGEPRADDASRASPTEPDAEPLRGATPPGGAARTDPAVRPDPPRGDGDQISGQGQGAGPGVDSTVGGGPATPPADESRPQASNRRPGVPPFAPDQERVGITDDAIKLCTHINGQVTAALGSNHDDARVFWRWLNEEGGVDGRRIDMVIADDGDGSAVAAAYEECRGSFLIIGGPSQEAVPSFREIVEHDPEPAPYLHFMAREDSTKRYSFSWYPSQERYATLAAQFVVDRFRSKRIGILRRDTENWSPGYQAFVTELRRHGVKPVAALGHPPREQIYEPYLAELAAKDVEVVWAWQHGVEHVPALKQAAARDYRFTWVLGFPLNLVSETLREDLLHPRVTGVTVFPAFRPGVDTDGSPYEREARLFEAAYRRYRGKSVDPVIADLLLRQWLDGRQLVDLLDRCGRDCTRTEAISLLIDELEPREPVCPFDFSLGRASGRAVSSVEAYAATRLVVSWRETAHCSTSF